MSPFYQLNVWYRQPLGIEIAKSIKQQLDDALADLFGYYLLQVGMAEQQSWLKGSPIKNKIIITDYLEQASSIAGQGYELPFANESCDVIVLPHTLEISDKPRFVLEEAYRVLTARGTLLIIGFNPLSLWGVLNTLKVKKVNAPFNGHLSPIWKIRKDINQIGFTFLSAKEFFYKIPVANKKFLKRCAFLETLGDMVWLYPGCCYLVIAQKHVPQLQLIKPMWRLKKYIVGKRFQLPGAG